MERSKILRKTYRRRMGVFRRVRRLGVYKRVE